MFILPLVMEGENDEDIIWIHGGKNEANMYMVMVDLVVTKT